MLTTRVEEGLGFEPRLIVLVHLPLSICDSIHDLLGLSPPLPNQGARAGYYWNLLEKVCSMKSKTCLIGSKFSLILRSAAYF
jgi:hypothetical protein